MPSARSSIWPWIQKIGMPGPQHPAGCPEVYYGVALATAFAGVPIRQAASLRFTAQTVNKPAHNGTLKTREIAPSPIAKVDTRAAATLAMATVVMNRSHGRQ